MLLISFFIFLVVSCCFWFFFSSIYFYSFLLVFFIFLLCQIPFFFQVSLLSYFFIDEVVFYIVFISLVVFLLILLFFCSSANLDCFMLLYVIIILVCFIVFSSSNLLWLYTMYESSLIPIILVILFWGHYPERSASAIILLFYTSIFSIPFMYFMLLAFSMFSSYSFFYINYISSCVSLFPSFFSIIIFIVFAVKLPIYGLHFWLPIAHVEAPTRGSMLLAGVLLKLGAVGLLRCSSLFLSFSSSAFFCSYFVCFILYSTLICCFQSDFKRLIAYSSVAHIIAIPILFHCFSLLRHKTIILLSVFHGFSSPLLFSMVGLIYSFTSTRQIILIRGFLLVSPLFRFLLVLAFMFTVCIPPFPSFLAEVAFFISLYSYWRGFVLFLVFFRLLALVYNLNWLSRLVFSSVSIFRIYEKTHLSYLSIVYLFGFFLVCLVFFIFFSLL